MLNKPITLALLTIGLLLPGALLAADGPQAVTQCELLKNPPAFNHKLIKISGVVSRGFEKFTLRDDRCASQDIVWLELGGTRGSEVVYCCGDNNIDLKRKSPLVVEGMETTLVDDKKLRKFEHLTKKQRGYGTARVTIIGRFFSGVQQTFPGGTFWVGYGHMGMGTLLVIQQVLEVE